MIISPMDLYNQAQAVAPGSSQAQIAETIAIMRDGAPYSMKSTPFGLLPHWRAIILEGLLFATLPHIQG